MPQVPPTEIADRFQVKAVLGQGGIGVVYQAHDPVLSKDVAIKVLKEGLPAKVMVRFQQEAKAVGKLKHSNIIDVYDFGISDGNPYLVMELLSGQSLTEYLHSSQWAELTLTELIEIYLQIVKGLDHAHKNGVLHRDIKPSNIMLSILADGAFKVQLVDFGLAKLEEEDQSLTSTGATMGSPLYMSPEQVAAETITEKTDIYSLGVLMFETICGTTPFKGETAAQTMIMHRKNPAPAITVENFNLEPIPEKLIQIVAQCLMKLPAERPSTEQLGRALEEILQELNPVIEEEEFKKPAISEFVRGKFLVGKSMVTILVIAILALVISIVYANQRQTNISRQEISKTFASTNVAVTAMPDPDTTIARREFDYDPTTKSMIGTDYIEDQDILSLTKRKEKFDTLIMRRAAIKGTTLSSLKDLPITNVDLSHSYVEDVGIKNLSLCSKIEKLDLTSCHYLSNQGIKYLTRLRNLQDLIIRAKFLDDTTLKIISKIPSIRNLSVPTSGKVTYRGTDYIKTLKDLETLDISGARLGPTRLKQLNSFPKLHGLQLNTLDLKDNDLKDLTSFKLNTLACGANRDITEAGYRTLSKIKTLKCIYASGNNLNDKGLAHLLKLKPILLDISKTKVSPKGIKMIADTDSIVQLTIGWLNLEDSDLNCLKKTKLEVLDVQGNSLTDESLNTFSDIKSLKTLRLRKGGKHTDLTRDNARITGEAVDRFTKRLPGCIIQR